MSSRLILAFALSFVVHGGLLAPTVLKRFPDSPPRPALRAELRLPPKPPLAMPDPADALLKNTLEAEKAEKIDERPPVRQVPAVAAKPVKRAAPQREVRAAQRKISEHLFYPPEAVARGLEGEVRLIVKLGADGAVEDVHVGASSGYPILDNAAIKAAYAMGRLTGATSRELILPVIFRLQ